MTLSTVLTKMNLLLCGCKLNIRRTDLIMGIRKTFEAKYKIPFWAIALIFLLGGYISLVLEDLMVQNNILNMQYNSFPINALIRVVLLNITLLLHYCGIKTGFYLLNKNTD